MNNKIKLTTTRKVLITMSVVVLLALSLQFVGAQTSTAEQSVLITTDGTVSPADLRANGASIVKQFNSPIYKIKASTNALHGISQMPGVISVETDQIYTHDLVPNDPDYDQLWGMDKIDAPLAWDVQTDASSVIVAVIDTGTQINHDDLAANIWTNPNEVPGDGIDNDGNGFVDDVNGWDFYNGDNSVYDGTQDDHGTHVSGTIGGVGNNAIGVSGVSWNVQIMPIKFLGSQGGSTTDAISAIEYATMMGADIISASWGGGGFSDALKTAIDNFPGLFAAAAGNDGVDNDASPHYPSSYTSANIISVASSTSSDGLSSFSNYGGTSVDISAPGSSIYSTLPDNTYGSYSGTSMATPHISGAAALMLANDPSLTAADLKQRLMDYGDPVGHDTVSGARLNLYQSLTLTPPPPPPPSTTETFTGSVSPDQVHTFSVTRTGGNIDATLSWSTSADIDMYLYEPGVDPTGNNWVTRAYTLNNPETMSAEATVTGDWSIRVNLYSGSDSSYTLDVTYPIEDSEPDTTPPSQVTGLNAVATGETTIDLTWTAATDDVGVTGYNIYRDGVLIDTTTGTSYSDSGLASSTTYTYEVSAFDAAGNEGALSNPASATTDAPDTTPPGQVTGLSAVAVSDSQIDLSWDASSASDLDHYNIYRDGVFLTSTTSVSYSDTGLVAETTYTYTVSAVDTTGNEGQQSTPTSATTEAAPQQESMHVSDITLTNPKNRGPWSDIQVDVTIVDSNGQAVAGASVTIDTDIGTFTATTDSNGVATFYFEKALRSGGTFTATVTDVSASGYVYDSASNIETSDSITV